MKFLNWKVFCNKWFAIYFLGATFSKVGSQIYRLAIPWFVFERTNSIGLMSLMWIVEVVPFVILGPFLGAMVDKWNRKKVMIWSDFGRFILVAMLPFLSLFGTIPIEIIFVIGFLLSIFTLCFDLVADFDMLPRLVKEEQLTSANSIYIGMDNLANLLGPAIAGLTIALVGTIHAVLLDAFSYLITLIVVIILPIKFGEVERSNEKMTLSKVMNEVKEGVIFLSHNKILWTLAVIGCLYNLAVGALYTVMTFHLANDFNFSASFVGNVYSIMGAMALLGSFIAPFVIKYMRMGYAITLVGLVSLVGTIILAVFHNWQIAILGYAILNIGGVMLNIYTFTIRQKEIPNQFMGRINAVYRMVLTVSFPLSGALLGGLASIFGAKIAFMAAALVMFVLMLFIIISKLSFYQEDAKERAKTVI
ncbi:TPA: MFS transporter [Bacillus pseudomycoides]|nr:MFS transporter [Bacillus pseudomycoides]